MKKIFTLLALLLTYTLLFAVTIPVPQKMSYQAVIRNSSNALVTNHLVGIKISILQTSATGTVVYSETQTPTSNANGLINIAIGAGVIVSGTFSAIDWSAGPYFIKTEVDPAGGTAYSITATSELLSVPYAQLSKDVQNKQWTESGSAIYFNTGKVGIGKNPGADARQFQVLTTDYQAVAAVNNSATYASIYASNQGEGPAADFRNKIRIADGTQATGKVLTSDANGYTSWSVPDYTQWTTAGNNIYYTTGNVGIGTATPGVYKLYVKDAGNVYTGMFENNGSSVTLVSRNYGGGPAGNFISNGTTYTLYAQNTSTGPAAYFDGTLKVAGGNTSEINRSQTGDANTVSICYGSVEASGTKNTGGSTANFTVTKISTGVYDITITDETYSQSTHCAIASLGDPGFINTNAVGGKLRVYTYSTSNVAQDREFSFVVYKP